MGAPHGVQLRLRQRPAARLIIDRIRVVFEVRRVIGAIVDIERRQHVTRVELRGDLDKGILGPPRVVERREVWPHPLQAADVERRAADAIRVVRPAKRAEEPCLVPGNRTTERHVELANSFRLGDAAADPPAGAVVGIPCQRLERETRRSLVGISPLRGDNVHVDADRQRRGRLGAAGPELRVAHGLSTHARARSRGVGEPAVGCAFQCRVVRELIGAHVVVDPYAAAVDALPRGDAGNHVNGIGVDRSGGDRCGPQQVAGDRERAARLERFDHRRLGPDRDGLRDTGHLHVDVDGECAAGPHQNAFTTVRGKAGEISGQGDRARG